MFTNDRYLYAGLFFVLTVKCTKKFISLINYLRMIAFSNSECLPGKRFTCSKKKKKKKKKKRMPAEQISIDKLIAGLQCSQDFLLRNLLVYYERTFY